MKPPDESHLQPYREAIQRLGPDSKGFEAALWGSRESQVLRFDVFINLINVENCILLDIGCGTGDLAQHLLDREVSFSKYIGVDAVSKVIEIAHQRHLPKCEFHELNVFSALDALGEFEADYAILSGTLNTMEVDAAMQLVKAAFDACAQGVIFNFLSDRPHRQWLDRDLSPARRFNTLNWLDWALDVTPRVSFTQDYLDGHDATILMQH